MVTDLHCKGTRIIILEAYKPKFLDVACLLYVIYKVRRLQHSPNVFVTSLIILFITTLSLSLTHTLTLKSSQFLYTFALFPTRGRLYEYADNSVKATIESYKKACSDSSGAGSTSEANAQYYQQEITKPYCVLKLVTCAITTEIDYMQKREVDLHNNNQLLLAKIAESERNQEHNMNVLASSYENASEHNNQFDSRAFFQVTGLQPHYPPNDHIPLQLAVDDSNLFSLQYGKLSWLVSQTAANFVDPAGIMMWIEPKKWPRGTYKASCQHMVDNIVQLVLRAS
ncbi:hypothetical protein K1719_012127 [Acacia pycnantha]|nr:hypothetical protein K1719_012127 [Acacia pycnantha]